MITRRTFLHRAAQAGIAAAVSPELFAWVQSHPRALSLDPQPLRIPPVITGGDLTLAPGTFRVYPDVETNLLLINGSFPSPTIKIRRGDTFAATVHNQLAEETVLHWHGVDAPAAASGHPIDVIATGSSYSVSFPIVQRASINFYHPHPHMATARQVYMGMAGFFLIEDAEELAMGLPSGEYDVPLMVQDKRVDANRQLIYNPTGADIMSAWLGDTILINGTPNPFLAIAPTLYRFRIVNASNGRFYKLALSDGSVFIVIGNDGGFLDAPTSVTSVNLAPAERLDVLIDFSRYAQGQSVTLKSLSFTFSDAPGSGAVPQGAELNLLEFQISKTGTSGGTIPTTLPAIIPHTVADAKRTRVWTFAALHHINDLQYDLTRIDAHVPFGDLEQWTFQSEGANTHPVHVHGGQFQVVDRDGNPPDVHERGWKDVIRLDPFGKVNVLMKFDKYPGLFVIHCHKLEHADAGMMANFQVDPQSGVDESAADASSLDIIPNPAADATNLHFPTLRSDESLTVVNARGATVVKETLSAGTDRYLLLTNGLASGTYTIELGRLTARLLVMRADAALCR
ncbi:MAG: multicopper oxidase domain-containing protein [Bacteroidota bacterium]|nr:multicopper oxidase domain-containing protein [Bacteroidota bacterium]MDP4233676.1 multicopper oxidase domain-containing protein [Bacteroidota bacterium]MDP4241867.1 multicopper oxidase domain-containing protein [Bacteroidota bacterium]MDP4288945.1 multicopper oxidase domain-containing protein [Bacteroidota bacterium]